MHHLLIVLVGIALAVATTVAAVPYLGKHFTDTRGEAIAATVLSQLSEIRKATDTFIRVEGRAPSPLDGVPLGELSSHGHYLKSIPRINGEPWSLIHMASISSSTADIAFSVPVDSAAACRVLNGNQAPIDMRDGTPAEQALFEAGLSNYIAHYCADVSEGTWLVADEPVYDACATWDYDLAYANGAVEQIEVQMEEQYITSRYVPSGWSYHPEWVEGYWLDYEVVWHDPPLERELDGVVVMHELGPPTGEIALVETYDPENGYVFNHPTEGDVDVGIAQDIMTTGEQILEVRRADGSVITQGYDLGWSYSNDQWELKIATHDKILLPEDQWQPAFELVYYEEVFHDPPVWVDGYVNQESVYNGGSPYWEDFNPPRVIPAHTRVDEVFVLGDGCIGDMVYPREYIPGPPRYRFVAR